MSKQNIQDQWRPDVCPITGRQFFMWIEHHETGLMVPTYGGPFDSHTIPIKDSDGDFVCERYDHDRGGWLINETECIGLKLVDDQLYTCEEDPASVIHERDELLAALESTVSAWEKGDDVFGGIQQARAAIAKAKGCMQ